MPWQSYISEAPDITMASSAGYPMMQVAGTTREREIAPSPQSRSSCAFHGPQGQEKGWAAGLAKASWFMTDPCCLTSSKV